MEVKKKAPEGENMNVGCRELPIGSVRKLDGEGNERKVELSFSSEEPYTRWFGPEILDHSEGAVDMTRLNEIGCVLFNHNRDRVIGKILSARLEDNRGVAEVEFDTDDDSELIYQKVLSGSLKGVSVGYMVDSFEEVLAGKKSADDRFTGPCYIARKWAPYEISIVSVPADPTVGVGRELDEVEAEVKSEEPVTEPEGPSVRMQINERQLLINEKLLQMEETR